MTVFSLGYVAMEAADPAAWADYARNVFGATASHDEATNDWRIRIDERSFRVLIQPGVDGKLTAIGWQVRNQSDFRNLLERVRTHQVNVTLCTPQDAAARDVTELARLADPSGNMIEIFYGSRLPAVPFMSPLETSRLQLGHAVLRCESLAESEQFYVDVLGLGVSDYINFEARGAPLSLIFLHAWDRRHHSLALAGAPNSLDHIMIEVDDVNAVGRCWERARQHAVPIRADLGRHSNDHTFSYYGISPNGIAVECGCDGIQVDPDSWRVKEYSTPSLWGHRPG